MAGPSIGQRSSKGLPPDAVKAHDFARFMRMVRIGDSFADCWEWTGNKPDGRYGHFSKGQKVVKAHRWIYEFTCSPIPESLLLRHKCDNPACVNPTHLEPGTPKQNIQDMLSRGRGFDRRGEKHPLARLCADDVRAIRLASAKGMSQRALATQYGVGSGQIGKIVRRENWKHI